MIISFLITVIYIGFHSGEGCFHPDCGLSEHVGLAKHFTGRHTAHPETWKNFSLKVMLSTAPALDRVGQDTGRWLEDSFLNAKQISKYFDKTPIWKAYAYLLGEVCQIRFLPSLKKKKTTYWGSTCANVRSQYADEYIAFEKLII